MKIVAILLAISWIIGAISGISFFIMDLCGYVNHKAKWSELKLWQWICFYLLTLFPISLVVLLILFLVRG